ncbi:hypothetical protein [Wolbachia endosymbiont of Folsomia candida]|nr:hypothetical protein [Wolbachia endosymbiont of Folsomia candida]
MPTSYATKPIKYWDDKRRVTGMTDGFARSIIYHYQICLVVIE